MVCDLNSDMSSNKQISTEEMLNPIDDLAGYIDSQTAEILGIKQYFYSVWSHYNKGNSTQILIPLDEGKTPYARVIRPTESYDINYRLLTNADIKKKNVSGSVTNYGNISLQLTTPSIVLGTRIIGNTGINSLPFTNGIAWYAYMVRNTAGTTINFVESGTEVEVEVYYIDQ